MLFCFEKTIVVTFRLHLGGLLNGKSLNLDAITLALLAPSYDILKSQQSYEIMKRSAVSTWILGAFDVSNELIQLGTS